MALYTPKYLTIYSYYWKVYFKIHEQNKHSRNGVKLETNMNIFQDIHYLQAILR